MLPPAPPLALFTRGEIPRFQKTKGGRPALHRTGNTPTPYSLGTDSVAARGHRRGEAASQHRRAMRDADDHTPTLPRLTGSGFLFGFRNRGPDRPCRSGVPGCLCAQQEPGIPGTQPATRRHKKARSRAISRCRRRPRNSLPAVSHAAIIRVKLYVHDSLYNVPRGTLLAKQTIKSELLPSRQLSYRLGHLRQFGVDGAAL